jgi:hypothetical protein
MQVAFASQGCKNTNATRGLFKQAIPTPLPYSLPRQVVVLSIRCEL